MNTNRSRPLALALGLALSLPFSAAASEATVYFPDGSSLSGDLRSNDEGFTYIIVGGKSFPIDVEGLRCEGVGCPNNTANTATSQPTAPAEPTPQVIVQPAPPAPKPAYTPRFGIYGSNTIGAELMPRLIEAYAASQSANTETAGGAKAEESLFTVKNAQDQALFEADLRAHGSGTAFPGLQSGAAEIGMASRAIKDTEAAALQSAGIDNMRQSGQEHVVALDGLIVIVAQDNPIKRLSLSQVADLFSGKINNWAQVGGANRPVSVYARDNQSGTFDTFKSLVLKPNQVKLAGDAQRFESNEALSDAVAADAGAIGFTGFAYARNAKPLALESECGMTSEPTIFNVKTEEYPLARRLYLYTSGKSMTPHAQGLLDYAPSDGAQDVIADVGFIEQTASLSPFDNNGRRATTPPSEQLALFQQLVKQLKGSDRLSTTFRFRSGSSDLDVKAVQDITRIATALADPNSELYGRQVTLIGYADADGRFASNQRLSKNRADSVRAQLANKLPPTIASTITTAGYSELMPVACNTNEAGKNKNRRVEIWVK